MTTKPTENPVHDALLAEHHRLDDLLAEVVDAARADQRSELADVWREFEGSLLAHLNREEMFLLPTFERQASGDAASIRSEHAAIRASLGELGIMLELHALRVEQIEAFVARLRDHAAREETSLYRFADTAPPATTTSLLRRLRDVVPWRRGDRHAQSPRAGV